MAALSSFVGPLSLVLKGDRHALSKLRTVYLPHILRQRNAKFFMNVYYEQCFDMPITQMRKNLGLTALTN